MCSSVIVRIQPGIYVLHLLWASAQVPAQTNNEVHRSCMQPAPCMQPPSARAGVRIVDLHHQMNNQAGCQMKGLRCTI